MSEYSFINVPNVYEILDAHFTSSGQHLWLHVLSRRKVTNLSG